MSEPACSGPGLVDSASADLVVCGFSCFLPLGPARDPGDALTIEQVESCLLFVAERVRFLAVPRHNKKENY